MKKFECDHCFHVWVPRKEVVKRCPKCGRKLGMLKRKNRPWSDCEIGDTFSVPFVRADDFIFQSNENAKTYKSFLAFVSKTGKKFRVFSEDICFKGTRYE